MKQRLMRNEPSGVWTSVAVLLLGCGGVAEHDGSRGAARPDGVDADAASASSSLVLAKSGTRLSAQAYESEGALRYRHFEDRELGVSCAFSRDLGGELRCFPEREVPLLFLDAACSQPATWLDWTSSDLTEGTWVADVTTPVCEGELPAHRAYRLGELVSEEGVPPPDVYRLAAGACQPTNPWGKSLPVVHRLVPQAPDALVSGRMVSRPVEEDLVVRQILASDGAKLNLDVTSTSGEPCALQAGGWCVPEPLADIRSEWADSSCEVSGYYVPKTACRAPRYALGAAGEPLALEKPDKLYVRAVAAPIPIESFMGAPAPQFTCEEMGPLPDVWVTGRDVSASLPKAQPLKLGRGALRAGALRLQNESASYVFSDGADAESFEMAESTCRVAPMADSTERCLAQSLALFDSGYFSDAECQKALFSDSSGEEVSTLRLLERDETERVGAVYTLAPYPGPVYAPGKAGCAVVSDPAVAPLLTRGASLNLTDFPLVQRVELTE